MSIQKLPTIFSNLWWIMKKKKKNEKIRSFFIVPTHKTESYGTKLSEIKDV